MLCSWSSCKSVAISGYALFRWKDEKATDDLVSQLQHDYVGSSSCGLIWVSCTPIDTRTHGTSRHNYELLLLTRAMGVRLSLNEDEDFIPCRSHGRRACVVSVVPQLVSFSDVDISTCPAFVFMTVPHI